MTDQKPNCSNCHTFTKGTERGESGMGFCQIDHRSITWQQWCIIKEKGCLSHPDAREYLMRDVLKELERLYAEENDSTSYSEGKADGYDRAHTLIKDGVKE